MSLYEVSYMDNIDYKILETILDLRIAYPRVERVQSSTNLEPEELAARLGLLEMEGYIKTRLDTNSSGADIPCEIGSVSITNLGRRALSGERWK